MSDIYQVLDNLNITYKKFDHLAVFTIPEAEKHCGHIPGGKSKNILLRNRKGDKHYLIVVKGNKRLNLEKLSGILNESKLSFASEKRLMKYLGLTPGAVSPFGLINDVEKEVGVIVDSDLLEYAELQYHPNINTSTLVLSSVDFKKFLENSGNKIDFIKL